MRIGTRVRIFLQGRSTIGLIISQTTKPAKFKTQVIKESLSEWSFDPEYIALAKRMSELLPASQEAFLGLMGPDIFFSKNSPVNYDQWIHLAKPNEENLVKGENQQKAISILKENSPISLLTLKESIPTATITALKKKGIIELEETFVTRPVYKTKLKRNHVYPLTPAQVEAYNQIKSTTKPSVLWGVTGSGKTEIYKKIASEITSEEEGNQVLFLLPEIALTPQLMAEFRNIFGDKIALWHSQMTQREKIQEWGRVASGEAKILLGTRSALWIPIPFLSLIILDEEHEWTFKNETHPRFWTHEVVEELAKIKNAKIIFGSATPRLESFKKCEEGEWSRTDLWTRVHNNNLPQIQIIDLKNEGIKGEYGPISPQLKTAISQALKRKKQSVLFLNRRGFSGATICKKCGYKFESPGYSLPMKLHKKGKIKKLVCHYSGYMTDLPSQCPDCKTKDFVFKGWGTQQVEEEVAKMFPTAKIARADADTIKGRYDFENLTHKMANQEIDILIGTQMVAKGLDFDNLDVCGIILADQGLTLPDFRSQERVAQLLTQVSGRVGRKGQKGTIYLQTFNKEHPLFGYIQNYQYEAFLIKEANTRKITNMPPYAEMVKITFKSKLKHVAWENSNKAFKYIKTTLKDSPDLIDSNWAPAFFPFMHHQYFFHIFLRFKTKESALQAIKQINLGKTATIETNPISIL